MEQHLSSDTEPRGAGDALQLTETAAEMVKAAMRREGLFIQKGKRLRLWLSDDAARRPLLMKVEVFFGHITAALREMV